MAAPVRASGPGVLAAEQDGLEVGEVVVAALAEPEGTQCARSRKSNPCTCTARSAPRQTSCCKKTRTWSKERVRVAREQGGRTQNEVQLVGEIMAKSGQG